MAANSSKADIPQFQNDPHELKAIVERLSAELDRKNYDLKIEASLERVRIKALAMRRAIDLLTICETLFNELRVLEFDALRNAIIHVFDDEHKNFDDYDYSDFSNGNVTKTPYSGNPIVEEFIKKIRRANDAFIEIELGGKELEDWKEFRKANGQLHDPRLDSISTLYYYIYSVGPASIGISTFNPISPGKLEILKRFRNVFDLAYRRYLDLTQLEAQAREARIEAALEKVRSCSLAMRNSSELGKVVTELLKNLHQLGFDAEKGSAAHILIFSKNSKDFVQWSADPFLDAPVQTRIPYSDIFMLQDLFRAKESGVNFYSHDYSFEEKNEFFTYAFEHTGLSNLPDELKKLLLESKTYTNWTAFENISGITVNSITGHRLSEIQINIIKRFARVFEQAYTRFQDLQKAEAQAKEAQIEAALERVRSKAMAMHSSKDLAATIVAFYHELESFSITPRRCGVGLLNKETRIAELSTMNTTSDGNSIEIIGTLKMTGHPVLEGVYDNWILQKEYHPVLVGQEIPAYYQLVRPQIAFPDYPSDAIQYGYFFFFPEGGVYAWTEKQMAEEELEIYRRFTSVLSLTYKRYKDLQQAEDLAKQAEEDLIKLKIEKKKTEDALLELKNTQYQLIQSEKMASLGELTAGIAHEIQNPLNFVNNFSDVSAELLGEMKECLSKGDVDAANEIAEDVKENLEKILHHGQRADAIVKSMLQHSRSSNGQKEPTDLNALADEYVRLAFHGWRAKDNSFNATFTTDFDKSIGKLNIISQDIGRVVLNLLNNAFYAVNDKYKKEKNGYSPTVQVSTKKIENKIEIRVTDNANGIPKSSLEKIFQPFFTTKPTGQGTGLGLSLSYDIIKAHNGELKVETSEGKGSTFIIQLPVT